MYIENQNAPMRSRLLTAGLGIIAMAAAGAANAQSAPAPGENGLMTFPNARVVSAPPSGQATPRFGSARPSGFLAFVDPATRALFEPSAEEISALLSLGRTGTELTPALPLTTFQTPEGAVGVVLDETFLSFVAVRKNADGSLDEACVTGKDTADRFVTESAAAAAASSNKTTAKGALK